jgi:nucleoid-associated protein YgaU
MTQSRGTYAEATITNLDTGESVRCLFRPKEYQFSKTNSWTAGKVVGQDVQPPTFGGGQPKKVSLELLFDTYDTRPDVPRQIDVREITGKLWKMMYGTPRRQEPVTELTEPPHVEFRWGRFWSFEAVIESITEKFTLFSPEGMPLRSTVNISLLQAKKENAWPGQNPTSGGAHNFAVHVVKEGETIDTIAFEEYGDPNAWRHLAAANRLDDPTRLRPGQRLIVAPLR